MNAALRLARAYGVAVSFADLGDWGTANCDRNTIRAVRRFASTLRVARRLSGTALREFVALAIAHELYHHREHIGEIARTSRSARGANATPIATHTIWGEARGERIRRRNRRRSEFDRRPRSATRRGRIVGRGSAGPADEVGAGARLERGCATRCGRARRGAVATPVARRRRASARSSRASAATRADVRGITRRFAGGAARAAPRRADRARRRTRRRARRGRDRGHRLVRLRAGAPGVTWSAGGWGYLFGDEGSAFWLAREALAALMRWEDDGTPHADDGARAPAISSRLPSYTRGRARILRGRDLARGIAAFAPVAMQFEPSRAIARAAPSGSPRSPGRRSRRRCLRRSRCAGGMFGDAGFARTFRAERRGAIPAASVVAGATSRASVRC